MRFRGLSIAYMAGAKRGGGGRGGEKSAKGKSEGSACSESLCFCNAHQFSRDPITCPVNQVSLHSPIRTQR